MTQEKQVFGSNEPRMSALERHLLNDYQRDFPLSPTPFADIGEQLGVSEEEVLSCLKSLRERNLISRVGPVLAVHRAGASTLAAMAVPASRLEQVAGLINDYQEVNHNYLREHRLNLWFVLTAPSEARLGEVLDEIEAMTGIEVLDLPLEQQFHIDLGFSLWR